MSEHQDNCIFCKIIKGEIPCASLLETENLIVFLDINPINKGHALIVPKQHAETIFDMPESLGCELVSVMKRVGTAIMQATAAEGLNVIQNNYPAAGQQVAHIHWHLIPRHADDHCPAWPQKGYAGNEEMTSLLLAIREKL